MEPRGGCSSVSPARLPTLKAGTLSVNNMAAVQRQMKRQMLLPCSQKHNPPWTPDMGESGVGRIPSFRQGIQSGEYPELRGERGLQIGSKGSLDTILKSVILMRNFPETDGSILF